MKTRMALFLFPLKEFKKRGSKFIEPLFCVPCMAID